MQQRLTIGAGLKALPAALNAAADGPLTTRDAAVVTFGRAMLLSGGGYFLMSPDIHPGTAAAIAMVDGVPADAIAVFQAFALESTAARRAMGAPEKGSIPIVLGASTTAGMLALKDYVQGVSMRSSEAFAEVMASAGPAARQMWWALREDPADLGAALPLKEADVAWFGRSLLVELQARHGASAHKVFSWLGQRLGDRRLREQSPAWIRKDMQTAAGTELRAMFGAAPETLSALVDAYLKTLGAMPT